MYIVGDEEIEAVTKVLRSGALFRYNGQSECERFERRYAEWLGSRHFALTVSGTYALAAAMTGLGIGPGDEVLIPAHTYMATATSVLVTGAIPVIVDIDESLTISPGAVENAIGPRTKAVIPVHMWGAACDMDAIMRIARDHNLLVIEDACQGVGGGYEGRKFGAIGDAGAFSFNYFKNMTCGEGGGVATSDDRVAERIRCAIDPCHFYWQGRTDSLQPFAGNGGRASEIMGALLNVQLDRIDGMVARMRRERQRMLAGTRHLGNLGLLPTPMNSPDHDCATHLMYLLPNAEAARLFAPLVGGVVAGATGRHNYTEWDQVLMGKGAAHPAMNPYHMPANAACRRSYARDMCAASLDILRRTVMIPMHPLHADAEIDDAIHDVVAAARHVLEPGSSAPPALRLSRAVDKQKFDAA
jgi:dTDP-4-amino-4,6-dideoxygalactose transaminase